MWTSRTVLARRLPALRSRLLVFHRTAWSNTLRCAREAHGSIVVRALGAQTGVAAGMDALRERNRGAAAAARSEKTLVRTSRPEAGASLPRRNRLQRVPRPARRPGTAHRS